MKLKDCSSYIYSNAGNLFFDLGEMQKSLECHKGALKIEPTNINSLNGIGLAYSNSGNDGEAIKSFEQALSINPVDDYTNFNLGNLYRVRENYKKAIDCYEHSERKLSKSHQLECIYKGADKDLFNKKLQLLIDKGILNPLIGSLSSHAAIRYSQRDEYSFCKDPFLFLEKSSLYDDKRFNNDLIKKLVSDINLAKVSKKTQSLLENGVQSSGNLFFHELDSINLIKKIINDKIIRYREAFSNSSDMFLRKWPEELTLTGWLIIMQSGGNLKPHMHKEGWLSGSIYLQMPEKRNLNDGDIVFSLNGGDYPTDGKSFPNKISEIRKGDIVLFPSSLFHSTIPFNSTTNRVTLAFDVMPLV